VRPLAQLPDIFWCLLPSFSLYLPLCHYLSRSLHLSLALSPTLYLHLSASAADSSVSVEFVSLVLKKRAVLGFQSSNEGELAAFISYAQAFPKGLLALVDTYDTVQRYGTGRLCSARFFERKQLKDVLFLLLFILNILHTMPYPSFQFQ
jgi:hypothetical protein